MKFALILLAVFIGLGRPVFIFYEFNEHVQSSYEAVAHGLTFGLLGAWLATRHGCKWTADVWDPRRAWKFEWGWAYITAFVLSWIEVICAIITFARRA